MNDAPELPLFYCIRLLRLEGPTNQALDGWSLDFDRIDKALDFLGIENYVKIRFSTSIWKIGQHEESEDYHTVTLSRELDADTANNTLWHELIHAKQAEDYSRQNGVVLTEFSKAYSAARGPIGQVYKGNIYEIEANALAARYSKIMLLQ
jgi:hypothetical protein